ncbi:glycosyl transferase family 90 [Sphingomonas sp. BIUV-7]|uniref:Glycosyl transferase family 90 n=1 Tax=Sphingomonas natans TaxID=3063330 RepID=A0ABT8Y5S9_9SPHN|nr:glycosyl transferase family 90 [Sphingomonas sp. BIUV-7]MDO6413675.1 glycosyl transferase family 90 [Sphingomonas sp. BIUV-7]
MVRIAGGRVQVSAPGWLLNAGATYAVTLYMEALAAELNRDPCVYGFDPGNIYTVFVQTWDRALTGVRSLAFGRNVQGQGAVGLMPDVYYINHRGYAQLRWEAQQYAPVWADRRAMIAWRGSVTGGGNFQSPSDIPRVKMALACRDLSAADVRLSGAHPTMASVYSPGEINAFLAAEQLMGEMWHMADFSKYRYSIDIDGHANAWSFLEKMILGCCVLKVASPYEQWFYDRVRPWEHYVPIKADLSDIEEKIEWCLANEARCEWIARNGQALAATQCYETEIRSNCEQLMRFASTDIGESNAKELVRR